MKISRDRKNRKLTLSQANYIEKVLQHFSVKNAKVVSTPLLGHLKLTEEICLKTQEEEEKMSKVLFHLKLTKEMYPKTQEEEDKMSKVPYASAIGSLMYAMVCTRVDIVRVDGVVSRYMSHLGIKN